jgi:hypothetical protein
MQLLQDKSSRGSKEEGERELHEHTVYISFRYEATSLRDSVQFGAQGKPKRGRGSYQATRYLRFFISNT